VLWVVLIAIILAVLLLKWALFSPISQVFGAFPYRVKTDQKLVALTFDDGPNEPYTSQLLDVLKREQVPATFFVVGQNLKKFQAVVKRAAAEGHTIANHSMSHEFSNYWKSLGFASEITQTQQLITQTTGQTPALFRPPWLFHTPWLLRSLKQQQLSPVSGTFVKDWQTAQPPANSLADKAYRRVKPGTILIFHDGYNAQSAARGETVEAIRTLIPRLKADGYTFVTADKLLNTKAYQTN